MDLKRPSTIVQLAFVAAVLAAIGGMVLTAQGNLARQHIATGFGFLFSETGWDVSAALIAHSPRDPYWRTFLVGLLNTLTLAAIGIVLSTLLGILIALARASGNKMMMALSGAYVGVVRNVPLIIQVFFWYHCTRQLPPARQSIAWLDSLFLSNRGLYLPSIAVDLRARHLLGILLLWGGAALAFAWARRRQAARPPGTVLAAAWIAAVPVVLLADPPEVGVSVPRLGGFNFEGGWALSPEFVALTTAIVVYNAAFIAEILRAGIRAVPNGQIEAARNIGLSNARIFWKIVIPQAFRVAIPPLTNQYISLTKSSSLSVAIGYTDLFSIGTVAINHNGQAIEVIALLMLVYLTISLTISALGNLYNRVLVARSLR